MEEIQKMDDPAPEICPMCDEKGTLERTLGVSNFKLSGSGWADDGYS